MKTIVLIMMLLITVCAVFATEVTLSDGRIFKGDLIGAQENRVVVQEDGVIIQIPAEKVKMVTENGVDVTESVMEKAKLGQSTDIHYIEDDDFFVSETALGEEASMKLKIAKLINPATQSTKMQAQFMLVGDGTQIWTKHYFTTKVGKVATIKPGQIVIYFEGKIVDGMFAGPQSDDEKRSGNWIMTKVKDTNTIGEGFISVVTGEKIAIDNLRIVAK